MFDFKKVQEALNRKIEARKAQYAEKLLRALSDGTNEQEEQPQDYDATMQEFLGKIRVMQDIAGVARFGSLIKATRALLEWPSEQPKLPEDLNELQAALQEADERIRELGRRLALDEVAPDDVREQMLGNLAGHVGLSVPELLGLEPEEAVTE